MIQWFFKWLHNKCNDAHNQDLVRESVQPIRLDRSSKFDSRPIRFSLFDASGGWVLEYTYYDERKDENYHSLHVVHPDEDIGAAISRIITFETLRK